MAKHIIEIGYHEYYFFRTTYSTGEYCWLLTDSAASTIMEMVSW